MTLPLELQAARLRLVKERPYLASAIWSLIPVSKPGLGTLAVDRWWRLYYDPASISRWSPEELVGVLYHEITHLLRDHASRMEMCDPRLANLATDAEINDDLLREKVKLPAGAVTPDLLGLEENLLAEEYYEALSGDAGGSQSGDVDGSQSGDVDGSQSGDVDGSQSGDADGSQSGDGVESDSTSSSDKPSTSSGKLPASSDKPSTSSGDQPSASTGQPANSSAKTGSVGAAGSKPGDGAESNSVSSSGKPAASTDNKTSTSPFPSPTPAAGRCGSCATGQQEPWEYGPPGTGEGVPPGISRGEAELLRREVARQIREASHARGNVPGHWVRWAEEKLRSKVNWRRELASAVRHAIAEVTGAVDYTYRRPSRRQGQIGNGKVILPSLYQPVPSVAVVVDTSGSISDEMLSQALAEVSGVLRSIGQREGVHVLAVDSTIQTCRRVFRPEQVKLSGGGGTDMRVGIEAATKLKPKPSVIIVITDGYTPWPDEPPRGAKVIVALTGDGTVPDWAKKIKVEAD